MYLSLILGTFLALCKAQGGQFTPARPPSVPLAVRSPYLNTWLDGPPNGGATWGHLAGTWPTFWTLDILFPRVLEFGDMKMLTIHRKRGRYGMAGTYQG